MKFNHMQNFSHQGEKGTFLAKSAIIKNATVNLDTLGYQLLRLPSDDNSQGGDTETARPCSPLLNIPGSRLRLRTERAP